MKLCEKCKTNPRGGGRLCRKCQKEWADYKNKINWQANKIKKKIIDERGNKCEKCKNEAPLIIHHITSVVDGGTNDRSNLILICKCCHDKEHKVRKIKKW